MVVHLVRVLVEATECVDLVVPAVGHRSIDQTRRALAEGPGHLRAIAVHGCAALEGCTGHDVCVDGGGPGGRGHGRCRGVERGLRGEASRRSGCLLSRASEEGGGCRRRRMRHRQDRSRGRGSGSGDLGRVGSRVGMLIWGVRFTVDWTRSRMRRAEPRYRGCISRISNKAGPPPQARGKVGFFPFSFSPAKKGCTACAKGKQ